MRWLKFFFVFALLLCLMEPCFVVAQGGRGNCQGRIRCKREAEKEADQPNTRIKRSLFSMLKRAPPPSG